MVPVPALTVLVRCFHGSGVLFHAAQRPASPGFDQGGGGRLDVFLADTAFIFRNGGAGGVFTFAASVLDAVPKSAS